MICVSFVWFAGHRGHRVLLPERDAAVPRAERRQLPEAQEEAGRAAARRGQQQHRAQLGPHQRDVEPQHRAEPAGRRTGPAGGGPALCSRVTCCAVCDRVGVDRAPEHSSSYTPPRVVVDCCVLSAICAAPSPGTNFAREYF
jgi:hypothetical protein